MLPVIVLLAAIAQADQPAEQPLTIAEAQVTLAAQVRVPARDAGTLDELHAAEGDFVEQGQVIGRLQGDLAEIDREMAEIEHRIAQLKSQNDVDRRFADKSHKVAEAELARSLESVELYPKSVSKTELDKLRLTAERASLSIEQAQRDEQVAALTESLKGRAAVAAQRQLALRQIVAPLSGMVVQVLHQPGEWLNPGDPVVRIVKLDRLRVEAFVDGKRFGSELLQRRVQLRVELPPGNRPAVYAGRITFVSPELQPVTGQMRIWAEVENHDLQLRPGMRGQLTIEPTASP